MKTTIIKGCEVRIGDRVLVTQNEILQDPNYVPVYAKVKEVEIRRHGYQWIHYAGKQTFSGFRDDDEVEIIERK